MFLIALAVAAAVPATPQPIVLGTSQQVHSAALGEDRTINVVLPASYAKEPAKRYPVLYLIDGGVDQDLIHVAGVLQLNSAWGRSQEAILVGIATKDRRRELTGPVADAELLKKYPTSGSSAKFRSFIRDQVKPLVERTYRTSGYDAVIGESLAGLFILDTLQQASKVMSEHDLARLAQVQERRYVGFRDYPFADSFMKGPA